MFSSSEIALYTGAGVSPVCAHALQSELAELIDDRQYRVREVNSDLPSRLEANVKALFVPGGNAGAMFYDSDLVHSVEAINKFVVQNQIAYFGVCAGGILACSKQHGRLDRSLGFANTYNANGSSFLNLYPGSVITPVFEKSEIDFDNIHLVTTRSKQSAERVTLFHSEGPAYFDSHKVAGAKALSSYDNLPVQFIAKVSPRYGCNEFTILESQNLNETVFYRAEEKPPMILTGSHLEINSSAILSELFKNEGDVTEEQQKKLAEQLQPHDSRRKALLQSYFEMIGLTCKNSKAKT